MEMNGGHHEQAFTFNRVPRRLEDLSYSSTQSNIHHIPTGRHRLQEEPVPAEILDMIHEQTR